MNGIIFGNMGTPETVAAALRDAFADHQAGRLVEARAGYRQVLSIEPGEPDALNLLGLRNSRPRRRGEGAVAES